MSKFADLVPVRSKFADPEPEAPKTYAPHSIAAALQWRIDESTKPGARKYSGSWRFTLRRLQRATISTKIIPDLKPSDLVDFGRERIAGGVKASTVNADITAIRSTISDYIASNDLPHEWLLVFTKARYLLSKEQLVGKSEPRERLPILEELILFREFYEKQNKHPNTKVDMALVQDGLVFTGRRISELCRIERQHVNVAKKTCMVYDLKNSKGKGHHGEFPLIEGALELFERRLAEIPNEPTARLFPFSAQTCSQRATKAKARLQKLHPGLFKNLRMHDDRAFCLTGLLKKGYTALQVRRVSLHKTTKMIDTVYGRLTAEDVVHGPLGVPMVERVIQ